VTVDILNDSGKVVRHLINFLPAKGYHNLYWDKRDDSGRQVPAGTYTSLINNCGEEQRRPIIAQYSKWELGSRINPADSVRPFLIDFDLQEDSASVSMYILNQRGKEIDSVCVDSILNKGNHRLEWQPEGKIYRGNYMIRLTIGDYTYIRELTYVQ
jgi:flagellar hook assembly protein FlgD